MTTRNPPAGLSERELYVWNLGFNAGAAERKTFFLGRDNDAHWYLVDNAIRDQWFAWLDIPSDDVRSWEVPEGAERLNGPPSMIIFHLADDTTN